jgi:hypothetical protein
MRWKPYFALFSLTVSVMSSAMAAPHTDQGGQTPATAPTQGTAQLPGDDGKIGTAYQLGNKGYELHFTLESAHVAPFYKSPDTSYGGLIAGPDQRLLVLTFFVQNPHAKDMHVNFNSFQFTAVSPDDKNFKNAPWLFQPDGKTFAADLKPAQKVRLQVVIPLYAAGPMRKIIVQRASGGVSPVLRYDLLDQVGKMISVFSPEGIDMLSDAKVKQGQAFDHIGWELEVGQPEISRVKVGTTMPYSGKNLVLIPVKFTNQLSRPSFVNFNTFAPTLLDVNGEQMAWRSNFIHLGSKTTIGQSVEPGESLTGLLVFNGLPGQKPSKLKLYDYKSRRTVTVSLN